jgi:hypothetical protein
MNWKETFDFKMRGSVLADSPYANELAKFYIQHEIIKKLIEDLPNHVYVTGHYDPETNDTKVQLDWLKQQLRDKWL